MARMAVLILLGLATMLPACASPKLDELNLVSAQEISAQKRQAELEAAEAADNAQTEETAVSG